MEYESCRHATKYPDKFRCYWGIHKYVKERQPIYENRNEFVEEFNIISYKPGGIPEKLKHIFYFNNQNRQFDHVEFYKTKDNNSIIVHSPYTECYKDWFLERGYRVYKPLYSSSAITYIKVVTQLELSQFNEKVKLMRKEFRKKITECSRKGEFFSDECKKYYEIIECTYPLNDSDKEYILIN